MVRVRRATNVYRRVKCSRIADVDAELQQKHLENLQPELISIQSASCKWPRPEKLQKKDTGNEDVAGKRF